MTDAFSEYVKLVDDIEQIPVRARESARLSAPERAAMMARVVELVRERVVPQSDRVSAGLDALLDDGLGALDRAGGATPGELDAILAPVDELAGANPTDAARVQQLLYRIHSAIAGHFSEAEVMLASGAGDGEPTPSVLGPGGSSTGRSMVLEPAHPSRWFG